jgi:hypothetical protein
MIIEVKIPSVTTNARNSFETNFTHLSLVSLLLIFYTNHAIGYNQCLQTCTESEEFFQLKQIDLDQGSK